MWKVYDTDDNESDFNGDDDKDDGQQTDFNKESSIEPSAQMSHFDFNHACKHLLPHFWKSLLRQKGLTDLKNSITYIINTHIHLDIMS